MLLALVSVVMVVSWIFYIALTVLTITGGETKNLIDWVIVTPFVLGLEWLGFQALERYSRF